MKNKKLLSLLAIAAPVLAACSAFSGIDTDANIDQYYNAETGEIVIPADQKVEIDWWTWGTGTTEAIFTNVAKKFMAMNPNIKINYTCTPSSTYLTKLANSSNHYPDVFFVPDTDFYYYAYSGVIWDFKKYVTSAELDDAWQDAIERYYYDPATKIVGKTDKAGLYAIPKDISVFQLAYNETLLKTACRELFESTGDAKYKFENIKSRYLSDTKTLNWDEFRELGNLINPYCRNHNKYFLSHYELYSALYSNNADFVTDDGSASRIEEPQFAAALDFLHSLGFGADGSATTGLMAGASGTSTSTGYNSFIGQNSIFSWVGPWDCETFWGVTPVKPTAIEFTIKMMPCPYGPGADGAYGTEDDGVSTTQLGSAGYCISGKTTTNNLQRAASLKFLKWMSLQEDCQRDLYRAGSMLPLLRSMKDEYIEFGHGQVEQYSGGMVDVNPSNLNVFIDTVDGASTASGDVVTGRAKTQTRTLGNEWKTDWSSTVDSVGFWSRANCTGAELVREYKDTLQSWIDQYNSRIGR